MSNTDLALSNPGFIMPVADINAALARYQQVKDFIGAILVEGVDFGKVPGSDKPCLLKPGAEKMCSFFGFVPRFILSKEVEDWTGKDHDGEPFFYYRYICQLWRNGEIVAEGEGSCNSWEKKYRYRWVDEGSIPAGMDKSKMKTQGGKISEFTFAIEKAETSGQYGKPLEYWRKFQTAIDEGTARAIQKKTRNGQMPAYEIDGTLYQLPNADPADGVNTYQKMSQKRSLVAPVLIATNTSDYFTQDIDDFIVDGTVISDQPAATGTQTPGKQETQPRPGSVHNPIKTDGIPPQPGEKLMKVNGAEAAKIFSGYTGLNAYEASKALQKGFEGVKEVTARQIEVFTRNWLQLGPNDLLPGQQGEAPSTEPASSEPAQPELPVEPGE